MELVRNKQLHRLWDEINDSKRAPCIILPNYS